MPETPAWPATPDDLALLSRSPDSLTQEEQVRKVRATFHELMLGEIERMLNAQEPIAVGAAILTCCAIDFLGTLLAGTNATGHTFRVFSYSYLKQYQPSMLSDLRNLLVHNYVVPPRIAFACSRDTAEAEALLASRSGMTLIIVDQFLADVRQAGEQLFQHSRTNDALRVNILARIKKPGLLSMYYGS